MSVVQVVVAIAGVVCVVGAVVAVTHRDPRIAGAALMATLLALALLYAGLVAPAVAAIVLAAALFVIVPVVVHLTVTAPRATALDGGPPVAGAAIITGAALLILLGVAIAYGELPLNVSVNSSDGYDLAGLRDLLTGRALVPLVATLVVVVAALAGVRLRTS